MEQQLIQIPFLRFIHGIEGKPDEGWQVIQEPSTSTSERHPVTNRSETKKDQNSLEGDPDPVPYVRTLLQRA
jgi:hypothetical protein